MFTLSPIHLNSLLNNLRKKGYTLFGPRLINGAVSYERVYSFEDFPAGITDNQKPALYEIKKSRNNLFFDFGPSPQSWKRFLFPPQKKLWEFRGNSFFEERIKRQRVAFIGVRPCELKAIFIQDRVFLSSEYIDSYYKKIRENLFLLVANCTNPKETCFCSSMKTGPRAERGFDLALTEILSPQKHYFYLEVGSKKAEEIIKGIPLKKATSQQKNEVREKLNKAGRTMKKVRVKDIPRILIRSYDSLLWDEVGKRCLACGNCTLVCPTCFCSTLEDYNDLKNNISYRLQVWDSCFNQDFTYLSSGPIRKSIKSRYRQWLIHKFGTWWEQFGWSGCVGCGRCIVWCPVGIDVREEIERIKY